MNESVTEVFVQQPLASPGSANDKGVSLLITELYNWTLNFYSKSLALIALALFILLVRQSIVWWCVVVNADHH